MKLNLEKSLYFKKDIIRGNIKANINIENTLCITNNYMGGKILSINY